MRLLKSKFTRTLRPLLAVLIALALVLSTGPTRIDAQLPALNPDQVRAAVVAAGLDSLHNMVVNDAGGLTEFLRIGAGPGGIDPVARQAAIQLGKALFWDRQVGSDGQACGSCHFVAFADDRTQNQLSPNLRNTDPEERNIFDETASGGLGPNYDVTAADFPFHQMADPLDENYLEREVVFDTDDVMSSQGVFAATFAGVPAPNEMVDLATPLPDPNGFQTDVDPGPGVNMVNVRRVEPRNTPSNINAVFNLTNFWDGRAAFAFNGVEVIGPLSTAPNIWVNQGGTLVQSLVGALGVLTRGSLASQSVGPPESFEEMSFAGRAFPDIGRKMLQGPTVYSSYAYNAVPDSTLNTQTRQPLQFQEVADTDSHLTQPLLGVNIDVPGAGAIGLDITFPTASLAPRFPAGFFPVGTTANMPMYQALIQAAFQPRWWDAPQLLVGGLPVNDPVLLVPQQVRINGYTLMEQNFALFFGIAVQMYEETLRADRTPFDLFMEGDDTYGTTGKGAAFGMTDAELLQARLRGLLTFIKTDQFFQQTNPVFNGINDGNCIFCHGGPELTNASLTGAGEIDMEMEVRFRNGRLILEGNQLGLEEDSFVNLGVRPSREDLGRAGSENGIAGVAGANVPGAFTLSGLQAGLLGTPGAAVPPPLTGAPNAFRILDDGAFKVPLLRNVELTGPYFHNGGQLTLAQVVQFYVRGGDFADVNAKDIEPNFATDLMLIEEADTPLLVHFLLTLTDERVRFDQAPFDHPQIQVPNGHPPVGTQVLPGGGGTVAADTLLVIPAVGAAGSPTPMDNFLGISSTPVLGDNNDHFDPQPPVAP